ncbi:MAG: c-type cytochrome [Comamonadaceae bacterium]|nr:c-type cytochrome [Comamonadaceae bacterium]MBN9365628.1 c-type cytochrome [Comamonadaceae bacterium]
MPSAFPLNRFALALLLAPLAAGAQLRVQDASMLAGTCVNCHGPEGRSTGAIPSLRGHTAGYLLQRLRAFRAGQAPDATVMTRLMKGYDDAQVEALAQWFATKEGR